MKGFSMLILSRREGERILIGDGVVITVVDILQNKVRIGIEAPGAVSIDREEIRAARIKSGIKLGHGKLGRCEHDVRATERHNAALTGSGRSSRKRGRLSGSQSNRGNNEYHRNQ